MQGSKRDFHYIDRTHREKLAIVPVFAVAPLAVIGGVMALLPSGAPLGFVAILGVLALIDILVRNSVILIVQIEDLRKAGTPCMGRGRRSNRASHAADHADGRLRKPRADPDSARDFWEPMAYAMMGGVIVGTMLTLLFLPALYVAWFRSTSRRPQRTASWKMHRIPRS